MRKQLFFTVTKSQISTSKRIAADKTVVNISFLWYSKAVTGKK